MKKKSIILLTVLSALLVIVFSASGIWLSQSLFDNPINYLTFSKGDSYEDVWKRVQHFEKKGLPKSALALVDSIYLQAKVDSNHAQYVKALVHKMKYTSRIEEDATKKIIIQLQNEADSSFFPLKPVLHSMMAEMYWMYYQQNSWTILNRTETVGFIPDDIATWDLKRLVDAVIKNYLASLENADSLKRTRIDLYDDVLYYQPGSRKFRPSLYDFLAHRAVDYFRSYEPDIARPADRFTIAGKEYFCPARDFTKLEIKTADTLSLKYYAVKILQDLLAFHIDDDSAEVWIDADLKRLQLMKDHSVEPDKDSLYLEALLALEKKAWELPIYTEVAYSIGNEYYQRGALYQPLASEENKWMYKKAYDYLESAIQRFPDSFGVNNCRYLQNEIKRKNISFTTEAFNLPGKPLKALVNYRNLDTVYFRLVSLDRRKHRNDVRELYGEEFIKFIAKMKPDKAWMQLLPDDGDYQNHSVEIPVPQLEPGYYIIMASPDEKFNEKNNAVAYSYTTVTGISYIQRKDDNENCEFYVMDRETGKPMPGITATLWQEEYSYVLRRYVYKKIRDYKADENAYIKIGAPSDYRYFFMEFKNGNDVLYTNESFYQYEPYRYDETDYVIYFFTDRSIYRPGQTVYFKGIVLQTDGENNKIVPGFSTTVYFYDANYQEVGRLSLTSNEYGSISGSFVAPQGVLSGNMHIENSYGSVYFSVEEYKRPKFEVEFDPVAGSYKLNEKIKVKGTAQAYAGSYIDGADVQYRVVRSTYFPYRWWFWSWYYPVTSGETVIKHGNVTTDEKGEFEIEFPALPDLTVSQKWKPSFTYTVTADVTDINGETHSSQQYVNVGYTAMVITTDLTEKINRSELKEFEMKTVNLNGEPVPAKGKIEIWKLKENERLFCNRKWSQPDRTIISQEDFYKNYPFEMYKDENNLTKLEKEKQVMTREFETVKEIKVPLKGIASWPQGRYLVNITSKDEFGEDVEYRFYCMVYAPEETAAPVSSIDWFTPVNNKGEPGDKAVFLVGSKDKDVSVLYEIEHKSKIVHKEWMTLSQEQKRIEIPIEEKHRGNFAIHCTFVKHNNVYTFADQVTVPYTNKELDISFATFRDKLQPGQEEQWKITIKGKNGDKAAAEMMATLYDASLDAFRPHNWYFSIYPYYYSQLNWYGYNAFSTLGSTLFQNEWHPYVYYYAKGYDALNWFGFYFGYYYNRYYDYYGDDIAFGAVGGAEEVMCDGPARGQSVSRLASKRELEMDETEALSVSACEKSAEVDLKTKDKSGIHAFNGKTTLSGESGGQGEGAPVKARTNFNETAFFYPHLETDTEGSIVIKFTIPEALTKWKMLGFAHTKDLKFGLIDNELITQKELMVVPNVPRFFRENDKITVSTKISNISKKDLSGTAQLMLFDALTMKPIDAELKNNNARQSFSVKAGLSTSVNWKLTIPEGIDAVTYRITAKAGSFSDGEENTIPVLTNRMLVTESMPLPIRSKETKEYKFEKLINSDSSSTLKHHRLTLEFTPNPAWYAVQALPYLIEYPYECAEQVFARYYANSIAAHIANSDPKIKRVFDAWKNTPGSEALLSNLEKNEELKALLLEETPWVLDAQDESARKRRVGLLFDLNHMARNIESAITKLEKMQVYSGGWTWFRGMPEDRYITQHIITGMGHLDHLGVTSIRQEYRIRNMTEKGVRFLDDQIRKDYEWIKRNYKKEEWDDNHLSYIQIQYLYARSYFMDWISMAPRNREAFEYFKGQAIKYWTDNNKYMQGMIALALHRFGTEKIPAEIMASIKEHALYSDEMGMYWKDNSGGWYWYQAPIETQALLIEAFDEVTGDKKAVDDMRVWLLKQKQTQDWKTTKATTEAVYALLLRGKDWLATESAVEITLGGQLIDPKKMDDVKVEAGTGYFKKAWAGGEVKPEMGNVKVVKKDEGVSWGAVYWQYFEQLDKITTHETPLKLKKKLFVERMTDAGTTIEPLDKSKLKVGDKVIVRIELRVDRDMEYVHMKDMRASGFEPINVLSQYKYQDGLGYYESTRDVSTNFFISYLGKGTYVFEYPLRTTHNGDFSNGITTIQCMYAPEFTSHSEGVRVKIGE